MSRKYSDFFLTLLIVIVSFDILSGCVSHTNNSVTKGDSLRQEIDWNIFYTPDDEMKDKFEEFFVTSLNSDTFSRSVSLIYTLLCDSTGHINSIQLQEKGMTTELSEQIKSYIMNEKHVKPVKLSDEEIILEYEILVRFEQERVVIAVGSLNRIDWSKYQ